MSNQLKMDKIEAIRNLADQERSPHHLTPELGANLSSVRRAFVGSYNSTQLFF